jgi:hypothetical protein
MPTWLVVTISLVILGALSTAIAIAAVAVGARIADALYTAFKEGRL